MEYRIPLAVRLIAYVFGPVFGLLGAALAGYGGIILADPAAAGSGGGAGLALRSLIGFCAGAGAVLFGLRLTRTAFLERLKVSDDGLISQVAGWAFRTRARTIPWSSITSFTTKETGRQYLVCAVLASGERAELAATDRERRRAEKIAGELASLRPAQEGGSAGFRLNV